MQSVAKLQTALKTFGTFARHAQSKEALQRKWRTLFGQDLSAASAESFLQHYRKLKKMTGGTRRRRTQRGGMAPLDYTLTPPSYTASPGMIGVYGNFPTEYGANPGAIDSMDRYFGSALQQGCGTENSSLTPPVDMGSNRVMNGGAASRRRRAQRRATLRRHRVSHKHRNSRSKTARTARKYRAKGGDMRYYLATVPPSFVQNAASAFAGVAGPAAADPTVRAWDYVGGTATPINPGT
jgi:hypothetical protein